MTDVFEAMGCTVFDEGDGLAVAGSRLKAVDVDMADMPDMVPTLAVVAAFAGEPPASATSPISKPKRATGSRPW